MSGQPELLAAGLTVKSLPMTINDRGRNQAQAGRALHAYPRGTGLSRLDCGSPKGFPRPSQSGSGSAAGALARSAGRGSCADRGPGCRSIRQQLPFPGLLVWFPKIQTRLPVGVCGGRYVPLRHLPGGV